MARESKGVRTLGALAIIAVVLLLVARFVIHNDATPSPNASANELVLVSVPSSSARSRAPSHARYESALVSSSINALSSGAGTALAVGDEGAILHTRIGDPKWTSDASPTHASLRAVAQQVDDAIAVGDDGTILELEGEHWKVVTPITHHTLRAIAYTSYGAIAVGDGGTIVRRPAPHTPWELEPAVTPNDFYGACAGLRDVWIVGTKGTIALRALDGWKLQPSIGAGALRAVACDDHAAIAVGDGGLIVERLDDVGWHVTASALTNDWLAVSGSIGARSWLIVGASGAIARVAGEPLLEPQSVDWPLRAVTEGALGTWIAGERGILRRAPM